MKHFYAHASGEVEKFALLKQMLENDLSGKNLSLEERKKKDECGTVVFCNSAYKA